MKQAKRDRRPVKRPSPCTLAAVQLLVLALWLVGCSPAEAPLELRHARTLDPPWPVAEFDLIDQNGQAFARDDLLGGWTLVFSGFTHCPDICPATLGILKAAQGRLDDSSPVRTLFVTVDPDRDTVEHLADYLAWFDEDWIGLTGPRAQLDALLGSMQMASVRVPIGHGDYTMDHATAIALLDPEARVRAYWPAPHDAESLALDLQRLPGRSSSGLRAWTR